MRSLLLLENPQTAGLHEREPGTDEEVVARVLDGDIASFEVLMRRHNQRLFRLARSIIRNDTEAEDIVQEAFVRAYAALSKFEGRSSFATWVTRIAYHEALRVHRKIGRDDSHISEMGQRLKININVQSEQGIGRGEVHKMVTQAFDKLTTTHRSVIMLRLIEGLSTRETAECLRINENHVKVLLHRAKAQFAGNLEADSVSDLRRQFSFAEERCDRIVRGVMGRIGIRDGSKN